jgi:hypothetical protein
MAIFEFKVNSNIVGNIDNFCVSVTFEGNVSDYRHGSEYSYTLEENEFLTFIFKNTTPENGYMNWDDNDDKKETRHHLKDINPEIIIGSYSKLYPFTLIQVGDNKLSWKLTWQEILQETSGPTVTMDETVTVTFGEDQPPDKPTFK